MKKLFVEDHEDLLPQIAKRYKKTFEEIAKDD